MNQKKITPLFCFLFLIVLGCNQTGSNKTKEKELQKVTVILDWTPNSNHTGIFVADELGYFKELGLDVEIIVPPEGGAYSLIASGKGEFGISYQEEVTQFEAAETPSPIKSIAAILQHNTSGFASLKSKNIKSPKDFERMKYGAFGSPIEEAILKAMMEKEEADFQEVEMINVGYADFFSIIETDRIDFQWIYYGWTGIEAEYRDLQINFVNMGEFDERLDYYTPIIIANEKILNENQEMVRLFLKATAKGYRYCISNPENAAQILINNNPELKDKKQFVINSQKYLSDYYLTDNNVWGEMTKERWDAYTNFLFQNGIIEKKVESKDMFTTEFIPKDGTAN